MRSLPAVALFVCSIMIFFQAYYCLKCYQCESSVNKFVPTCFKIVNEEFLKECKRGNVCTEARNTSVVFRKCESIDEVVSAFKRFNTVETFKRKTRVTFSVCSIDGCNDY